MIANPTATSAAATTMIKNTNTCPAASERYVEKAARSKVAAFNINSMDMKMMMAFLLINTPNTPIENRIALRYI